MLRLVLISAAAVVVCAMSWAGPARADTIINTMPADQEFYLLGGQAFGQTFTTPSSNTDLLSFTFELTPTIGGPANVVFQIYQWNGSNIVGAPVYQSAVTTINSPYSVTFPTWSPDTNLMSGATYIAFLNTSGDPTNDLIGLFISDVDYTGGQLQFDRTFGDGVWLNTFGDQSGTGGFDATFIADFGSPITTPLPATLPLFAGGLGLVGYLARRRKKVGTQRIPAA